MKISKQERDEAIKRLREWCRPGTTVYVVLRHRSASGMFRVIDLFMFDRKTGRTIHLGWDAAKVMGYGYDEKREGIKVGGCGMDMGFHLVNSLSYCLHGMKDKGSEGGRVYPRPGHYRAGYSLRHEWI